MKVGIYDICVVPILFWCVLAHLNLRIRLKKTLLKILNTTLSRIKNYLYTCNSMSDELENLKELSVVQYILTDNENPSLYSWICLQATKQETKLNSKIQSNQSHVHQLY